MATQGPWPHDFEDLSRQYWAAWNRMMQQAAGNASASGIGGFGQPTYANPFANAGMGMPGFGGSAFGAHGFGGMPGMGSWQNGMQAWAQMARGMGLDSGMDPALQRFGNQAGAWWGQMQQLAARFVGENAQASDIAQKWREMLEASSENAWLEAFNAMQGPQAQGFEHWYAQIKPWLEQWNQGSREWLSMPTFGVAREHQERLQKLAQAQIDYQEKTSAHNAMLMLSLQDAYEGFERKLGEHEAPGKEITSARALFDLWIDAAEEAFAKMALSSEYRTVYGEMTNAQMRLRNDVQREVELATSVLGMPTRTEIEAAHRKIAELERTLRRMQRNADAKPSRRTQAKPDEPVAARWPFAPIPEPRLATKPVKKVAKKAAKKAAAKPAKKATKKVAKKAAKNAAKR